MWNDVFERIRPGVLSSAQDIARAETELGLRLPPSFAAFARTLGAGVIGGEVRLFTPVPEASADLVARAGLIAHAVAAAIDGLAAGAGDQGEAHRFVFEDGADAALMERALFIGQSGGGAFVFLDIPADAAARDTAQERAVWVLAPDLETVRFGGPDLLAFVRGLQTDAGGTLVGAGPLPPDFAGDDSRALAGLADAQEPA